LKHRLATLDRAGWRPAAIADAALIEAEMNGLDFDLRVRQLWARDPSYYATVFGEESDVPAHEGPSADTIDLFRYPRKPGRSKVPNNNGCPSEAGFHSAAIAEQRYAP
jgi:hypothetical protein